jgi:hypothetical protein
MRLDADPLSNGGDTWWKVRLPDETVGWLRDQDVRLINYKSYSSRAKPAELLLFRTVRDEPARYWLRGESDALKRWTYTATELRIDPGAEEWFVLPLNAGQTVIIPAANLRPHGAEVQMELVPTRPGSLNFDKNSRPDYIWATVIHTGDFLLRVYAPNAGSGAHPTTYDLGFQILRIDSQ